MDGFSEQMVGSFARRIDALTVVMKDLLDSQRSTLLALEGLSGAVDELASAVEEISAQKDKELGAVEREIASNR